MMEDKNHLSYKEIIICIHRFSNYFLSLLSSIISLFFPFSVICLSLLSQDVNNIIIILL